MGGSPERKLIVKHTFLEIEEKAVGGEALRRRSLTDGAIVDNGDVWNTSSAGDGVQTSLEQSAQHVLHEEFLAASHTDSAARLTSGELSLQVAADSLIRMQCSKAQLAQENARLARENAQLRAMFDRSEPFSTQMPERQAARPSNSMPLPERLAAPPNNSMHRRPAGYPTATLSLSDSIPFSDAPSAPSTVGFTTVMLRNLPNQYKRDMLVDMLHAEGFAAKFNFVYLPIDFKTHAGLGYAFVDLTSPQEAERARRHFEGFSRWIVKSDKICSVSWSHPDQQGFATHVERYRNSPVMHVSVPDAWKPALLSGGERVAFPPPTRKIRVPRIRNIEA